MVTQRAVSCESDSLETALSSRLNESFEGLREQSRPTRDVGLDAAQQRTSSTGSCVGRCSGLLPLAAASLCLCVIKYYGELLTDLFGSLDRDHHHLAQERRRHDREPRRLGHHRDGRQARGRRRQEDAAHDRRLLRRTIHGCALCARVWTRMHVA